LPDHPPAKIHSCDLALDYDAAIAVAVTFSAGDRAAADVAIQRVCGLLPAPISGATSLARLAALRRINAPQAQTPAAKL
jgi:hypothetical protein